MSAGTGVVVVGVVVVVMVDLGGGTPHPALAHTPVANSQATVAI